MRDSGIPLPIIVFLIGMALIGVFLLIWSTEGSKREHRTIQVNGVVCDVVFVKTGEHCSHGSCTDFGYDKAVCPMTPQVEHGKGEH